MTSDEMEPAEEHELAQLSEIRGNAVEINVEEEEAAHSAAQSLSPCDGGIAAWRLLIAAFIFEALLWGAQFMMR